jgi:glycosidase
MSLLLQARRQLAPLLLLVSSVVAGCGDYSIYNGKMSDPWDPGPRKEGSGYGSGSGSGMMPPPPPMCDVSERRCEQEFVYRGMGGTSTKGDEKVVELRGDHKANGWVTGDVMTFDGTAWRVKVTVPWVSKFLYKFRIVDATGKESWIADPENPNKESDGFGGFNSVGSGVTCVKYTCEAPAPTCSATAGDFDWRDAVMYFVFVDRFFDGNPANNIPYSSGGMVDASANWKGGDWAGLLQKLKDGYFDALGVNALWLTVPMDNTDGIGIGDDGRNYTGYHGYWPRDLTKPERRFGTESELKAVIAEAHKRGIKVLVDYAMNHVHKDSPVYAMNKGWFNPLDLGGGRQCICGSSDCPWEGSKASVCWFRDYLPDFDFNNAAARKFSVDNALSWMQNYDLDGFRLDAVKHIEQSWLTDLRERITKDVELVKKQHIYLVGETYTGNRDLIKSFIDPCKKLDGQFDFPLRAELTSKVLLRQGRMQDLVNFMDSNTNFYGTGLNSTFIGNHDVPRSIHFAQNSPLWTDVWAGGKDRNFDPNRPGTVGETEAYERLGLSVAILMTNKGVPLLYYGDEIGLAGAGDPDNRRMMDWNSGGYNGGQKWLLDRTKKLGAIRKAHSSLRRGNRTTLSQTDDTWVYSMVDGADTVYVAINRADSAKTVSGLPAMSLTDQVSGGMVSGPTLSVPARGFVILSK